MIRNKNSYIDAKVHTWIKTFLSRPRIDIGLFYFPTLPGWNISIVALDRTTDYLKTIIRFKMFSDGRNGTGIRTLNKHQHPWTWFVNTWCVYVNFKTDVSFGFYRIVIPKRYSLFTEILLDLHTFRYFFSETIFNSYFLKSGKGTFVDTGPTRYSPSRQ